MTQRLPEESEECPRTAACLELAAGLAEFVDDAADRMPRVKQQQVKNRIGDYRSVNRLVKEVTVLCVKMALGKIVGPQPLLAYNVLSLARHFNQVDSGIDTVPLYKLVANAHKAGITDRDLQSAQLSFKVWLEGEPKRERD